jgi:hypothetical protein
VRAKNSVVTMSVVARALFEMTTGLRQYRARVRSPAPGPCSRRETTKSIHPRTTAEAATAIRLARSIASVRFSGSNRKSGPSSDGPWSVTRVFSLRRASGILGFMARSGSPIHISASLRLSVGTSGQSRAR